jgi:hypothetical protein
MPSLKIAVLPSVLFATATHAQLISSPSKGSSSMSDQRSASSATVSGSLSSQTFRSALPSQEAASVAGILIRQAPQVQGSLAMAPLLWENSACG